MSADLQAISERLDALTHAVHESLGTRLTRSQVLERVKVCSHTLTKMVRKEGFPAPIKDQWRLADIIEWERLKAAGDR